MTAPVAEQCAALLQRIGPDGTLTVLEPDRYRAAAASELDHAGHLKTGTMTDNNNRPFGIL